MPFRSDWGAPQNVDSRQFAEQIERNKELFRLEGIPDSVYLDNVVYDYTRAQMQGRISSRTVNFSKIETLGRLRKFNEAHPNFYSITRQYVQGRMSYARFKEAIERYKATHVEYLAGRKHIGGS